MGRLLCTALTLLCVAPTRPLPAGEDKRVHMWELGSWKPFAKAQPLQKAVCHSIGWAPWGGTGLGMHPSLLLATGGRGGSHATCLHASMQEWRSAGY